MNTTNPFGGGTSFTSSSQALSGSGVLRYVTKKLREENGNGGYIDTNYSYQGKGRESTKHWGFIGFQSQRITDSLGKNTYVQYRMDYPFFGAVASVRQYVSGSSSELIRRTDYVYSNRSVSVNSSGVSSDSPSIKSVISPVVAEGVTLGVNRLNYSRMWNNQSRSTTNGGSFTASFLSRVTKTEKYYRNFSASSPSSSVWGSYSLGDYGFSGEEKVVTSVTNLNNRTSSSNWLIGFVEGTSDTHTNRGYQATSNTTSYTRSTTYTPWGDTVRTANKWDAPINGYQVEHNYGYNASGNLDYHHITGGIARSVQYSNYVENRYPSAISDDGAYSNESLTLARSGYDLRFGYPQQSTNENGQTSNNVFDALGRKKQSTDEFGVTTTYNYSRCNSGNSYCYGFFGSASYMKTVTTPGKPTVRKIFDKNNRIIRTSRQGFDGSLVNKDTVFETNTYRVERVSLPYKSSRSPEWNVYKYDKKNRITDVTKPDGSSFSVNYTANGSTKTLLKTITESVFSSSGSSSHTKVTKQHFNFLGHMTKTIQGSGTSDEVTTEYDYNAYDQIDTVTVYDNGSVGSMTSYQYDVAGNVSHFTDSNSGTQRFTYHPDGRLIFHYQNSDSEVTEYLYDGYGRITNKIDTYQDGTEKETVWDWGAPNAPAKLYSVTKDMSYRETYTYNDDSLIESVLFEADYISSAYDPDYNVDLLPDQNKRLVINYNYYGDGDLKSKTYDPSMYYEYRYHYKYNNYGYRDEILAETTRFGGQSYATRSPVETRSPTTVKLINGMDAFGNQTHIAYGNGVNTVKHFDPGSGYITDIDTSIGSTTYQDNHYDWYSDGTLDSKTAYGTTQVSGVRKEKYEYDKLERLVKVKTYSNSSLFKTQNYSFDDLGNFKSQTNSYSNDNQVTNYDYAENGAGSNAATSYKVNGVDYSLEYNNTGSVTRYSITGGADRFIEYNLSKQPTKVVVGSSINDTSPDVLEEFKYNADGKLSFKRSVWDYASNTNEEVIYYFGDVELTSYKQNDSHDGSDTKIRIDNDILYVRSTTGLGHHEYLHKDYQGSVEAVTYKSSSNVYATNAQAFGVFGARESKNWKYDLQWGDSELFNIINERPRKNLGYTGHIQLERSGFIHMQGRLYDPVLGRFLSPDPIVVDAFNSQNWNRYSYVLNNPTEHFDPSGHAQVSVSICDPGKEISGGGDCPKGGFTVDQCRAQRDYSIEGDVCHYDRPDVYSQQPSDKGKYVKISSIVNRNGNAVYVRGGGEVVVRSGVIVKSVDDGHTISDVLTVSENLDKVIHIISGQRTGSATSEHYRVAVDIYIEGATKLLTPEYRDLIHNMNIFNRVASYYDKNTIHVDYKEEGNQGRFHDSGDGWVHLK